MIPLGSQRLGARGVDGHLAPSFLASQQPDAQLSQLWPWMVQWQPSPSPPPLPCPLPSLHPALESISNSSGHHCLQFLGQAQHRCQLLFHSPSFHFHSSAPAKPPIRVMPTRGGCGWMCACPPASPRARLPVLAGSHEGNFQHKDRMPERGGNRSANFRSDQNVLSIKSRLKKC